MLPETYESTRGGKIASYLGFEYSLRQDVNGLKQYRCREFLKFKCKATMETEGGAASKPPAGDHGHGRGAQPLGPGLKRRAKWRQS